MLDAKGAVGTTVEVRRVAGIPNDPKTGKLRLVKFEGAQPARPYVVANENRPAGALRKVEIEPPASFGPFARAEIEQSISARFEKQVENYSGRLAVKSGALSLTYGQLNRAANRLARAIRLRVGAKPEPVALLMSQGSSTISSILGILKAGKFYVPLDPAFPEARLLTILQECDASLIVTCDHDLAATRALRVGSEKILNVDKIEADIPGDDLDPIASPDSLAYLMYTSGSTGRPKGVMQNHRNVLHQIMTYTNGLRIAADDRLTQLHSHGVSASRLDIFAPLLNGAAVYPFAAAEQGMEPLARWLSDEKITLLHWVPTPFRHFAESLDDSNSFPDLRLIVLGSEPLASRDVDLYKRRFSSRCVLVNRYGTTETGNVRWHFINKETALSKGTVPVGYAVEDTEVLLLDEFGKSLSKDGAGEIAVKSRYLSPGYWRRPDLTAAAFYSDPTEPETKIYRTGDVGRLLADGCLLHLGRNDFQVKIRGYRVEVNEVERILLEHSAVLSAAVTGRADQSGEKRLVAYYVCAAGSPPTSATLRNFLSARVPGYMIPSAFVRLEALPLTPTGKVNYQALSEADSVAVDADVEITEARTPVEGQLAEIWKRVLGIDVVSIDHDFFDLGGHSLHAMTIVARLNELFHTDISIREFFESRTIARIAEMIDKSLMENSPRGDLLETLKDLDSISEEQASRLVDRNPKR
jgi:amino acid adenylation domain-containing protein